jgi:hypothetical protein
LTRPICLLQVEGVAPSWITERVFADPDEARAHVATQPYNYGEEGKGWRLFMMPCSERIDALVDRSEEDRPKIVCLCGSARFLEKFLAANVRESLAGNIVLTLGCFIHSVSEAYGAETTLTAEQKLALDELHLRKIDLADEILVLNVGGYIGATTHAEIFYAEAYGKPVRYLEPLERRAS